MGVTLLETANLCVQIDTLLSINICAVRVFIKRFDCQEPIGIKKNGTNRLLDCVATVRKMKSRQETTSLGQIVTVTAKPTISDKHL